jgi:hypothetical protein
MILNTIIDDQLYELNVPDQLLYQAEDFFNKMDADMANGIQMSRDWVETPDLHQRCQVVANKLLTAIENQNENLGRLMAGYLLSRLPSIDNIQIDTSGDMTATLLNLGDQITDNTERQLQNLDPVMRSTVEQEISKVFRAGKQWKFSTFNQSAQRWEDSAAFSREADAEHMRNKVLLQRYQELHAAR